MSTLVREKMSERPVCVPVDTPLTDVARMMREHAIGDVLVTSGDQLRGIVTDRDIVVRALAQGDAATTPVAAVMSDTIIAVGPDDDLDRAVDLMRHHAIRRLPVSNDGRPIGVISIGDLATACDCTPALADISTAPANA
jgi:CBS domain-containing protein